jgi:hypothetical protein
MTIAGVHDLISHSDHTIIVDFRLVTRQRNCLHIEDRGVPCALILWLAQAVNVVRPAARRLHIDCVRLAKGGRLERHAGSVHSWF